MQRAVYLLMERFGSLLHHPAATQRLVELHKRQMLIAHGIVQPDLGIEITSLGIEHVDIVDVAAAILDRRQFDVFDRRIAQALLAFGERRTLR